MYDTDTRSVIIGAGPAGLALAIELGTRSIPCTLVERNPRTGLAPRAKTTHSRTREHLRRWGVADRLAAASPFGVDHPSNVVFVTRLGGHPLKRFEHCFDGSPQRNEHYAEHGQWVPQYKLEAVLLERAAELPGVEVRFGRELTGFEQDDGGVAVGAAPNVEGGATHHLRAGLPRRCGRRGSTVRRRLGIAMEGVRGLSRNHNVIFRAPGLDRAHGHGPGIMYWQVNADAPSLIGPMDVDDRWFFMPTAVAGEGTLSDDEARAMILVLDRARYRDRDPVQRRLDRESAACRTLP